MPLAAIIPAPHSPVEIREVSVPDLERDSALLDVELSEVCGTDVHVQAGRLAGVPYPLIPGHVSVGRLSVLCIGAPEHRLDAALQAGACAVLNIESKNEEERLEWILRQTNGRGADVCLEATGAPVAVVQAMRFTRDAGRVVIVGQYTDHGPLSAEAAFNPHLDLNKKHLHVRGCWGSAFSHFYRGAQIISDAGRSAPWSRLLANVSCYDLEYDN